MRTNSQYATSAAKSQVTATRCAQSTNKVSLVIPAVKLIEKMAIIIIA
jgi:hypothetical protein